MCLLVAGSSAGASAAASRHSVVTAGRASVFRPAHIVAGARRRSFGPPLKDHHGRLDATANLYAIWWGDPIAWPADTQAGITDFLTNLGGSPYAHVAQQYLRGSSLAMTLAGTFIDTSPAPSSEPDTTAIAAEIANVLTTRNVAPDPAGIYVVFTASFAHGSRYPGYCAWHTNANIDGVTVAEAYMPNLTGVMGCGLPYLNENSYSAATRALANVTAHEVMESVTDPIPYTGWLDRRKQEIGDKCAWQFPGTSVIGSTQWLIQPEWSNAVKACALQ